MAGEESVITHIAYQRCVVIWIPEFPGRTDTVGCVLVAGTQSDAHENLGVEVAYLELTGKINVPPIGVYIVISAGIRVEDPPGLVNRLVLQAKNADRAGAAEAIDIQAFPLMMILRPGVAKKVSLDGAVFGQRIGQVPPARFPLIPSDEGGAYLPANKSRLIFLRMLHCGCTLSRTASNVRPLKNVSAPRMKLLP